MTNLDHSTQRDPVAERLARIAEHVADLSSDMAYADGVSSPLREDASDLLSFARDVLAMRRTRGMRTSTPQTAAFKEGYKSALVEIDAVATRHLGGTHE